MKSSALRVFYMGDHLGHRGGGIHGVTTYFLNALPAIEAEGVQPTVVFIGEQHPAAQKLENLGVQARFLGLKNGIRGLFLPLMTRWMRVGMTCFIFLISSLTSAAPWPPASGGFLRSCTCMTNFTCHGQ